MTDPTFPKVALAVVAHPDDAEFGFGGSLALWARDGWDCHLVICTDASGGGSDDAVDVSNDARRAITAIRKTEQRAAAKILGLKDVFFLDQPDGLMEASPDVRRSLVRLYRRLRPTRLLCQSPERNWKPRYMIGRHHPDHLAAGDAAIKAMYPASQNPWDFPELMAEGLHPHKIKELYVTSTAEPNLAIDISAVLDVKIEALRAHHSQLGANFEGVEKRVREWAAENGKLHGLPAAEIFHFTEQ